MKVNISRRSRYDDRSMHDLTRRSASVIRGTIRVAEDCYEYISSFSSGLRFRCLPGCGLCCRTYRIALTGLDLDRLKGVVDPETCPTIEPAPGAQDGGIMAFMVNGREKGCCYLDGNARCSVYDNRPLYCRTYPLIRDTYERLEMSVDYTCPGVGEGDPVGTDQIEEAFLLEARERPEAFKVRESATNYRVICASLKAMGLYTDTELIRRVCAELVRRASSFRRSIEVSAYFADSAAALAGSLAACGNITDPQAAERILEGMEEMLGRKRAETRGDGRIDSGDAEAEGRKGCELSGGAAESLCDYLEEWIRRQALLRFAHATAMARPGKLNVLHSFFAFLAHAASETLSGAEKLSRREGEPKISARLVMDAIRKTEGPLRSRCASVVSTY
jgi:Fe-S-cluster containining protein